MRASLFPKLALAAMLAMPGVVPALAQPTQSFPAFVREFEARAVADGISPEVYRQATRGLTPDPAVPDFSGAQPEFETPIWVYLDRRVSSERIARGQAAFAGNRALIERVGTEFGVDPYLLAAIWGMESDYGAILGNGRFIRPVIRSLATLVWQRRGRVEADEAELIAALRIIQAGDATAETLVGSWAGAIGHLQLAPTAFIDHALDYDGDGRRDPHGSLADALASSARFLGALGYRPGSDWGFEVSVPEGFDFRLAGREQLHPVRFFAEQGVRRIGGQAFAQMDEPVFLYVPAGSDGPKFLMTRNYLVLKGYNFSDSYALAVAHLTDRLKGAGPLVGHWPRNARFLDRQERLDLQLLLQSAGYYRGDIDGRLGPITSAALRDWQAANGLVADGFATVEALDALREVR